MKIEVLASMVHEANRAYCFSIEQYSTAPWDLEPPIIQNSVIDGIKNLVNNPDLSPEHMHELWMKYKLDEGWVYGEVKDVDALIHPCLKPYSELPDSDKVKDVIFHALVSAFVDDLEWDEPGGDLKPRHIHATADVVAAVGVNE